MKQIFTTFMIILVVTACSNDFEPNNNPNDQSTSKAELVKDICIDWSGDGESDLSWHFSYDNNGRATYIHEKWDLEYMRLDNSWEIEYPTENSMYINEKVIYADSPDYSYTNPFIIELNDKGMIDFWTHVANSHKDTLEYSYDSDYYLTNALYVENDKSTYYTSNIWSSDNLTKSYMRWELNEEPRVSLQFSYNNKQASRINIDLYPFISYPSELCPWFIIPLDHGSKISMYLLGAGYIGKTNANYLTEIAEIVDKDDYVFDHSDMSNRKYFIYTVSKFQWVYDEKERPTKCINTVEQHKVYEDGGKDVEYSTAVTTITYIE